MRKLFIAGNWKMNLTLAKSVDLAAGLKKNFPAATSAQVALIPAFVHLTAVRQIIQSTPMALGAQDVYFEKPGAFTGEIGTEMLKEVGVKYVLVGHSERRHILGETEPLVNKKLRAAILAGLTAILCVGETIEQRQANRTETVVGEQLARDLAQVPSEAIDAGHLVIAYEPVWAIGTGLTATPAQAQEVHALIRGEMRRLFGSDRAERIQIQYGGSAKKANAAELLAQPDIDGLLVGGASLIVEEFIAMVRSANEVKKAE
ncbi:MAG: triose-phosphate isomerase [Phycisphaerae bacterium]|nr:triose-phosphate isomerase [Phycisphaerae bacterium]